MTTSRKKILLAGTSFSAVPIFNKLQNRDFEIAVCGAYQNDPCHKLADQSFFIDYSDREALLDLVIREHFDYLLPSCNDYSYLSAAWVAQQTGLPGYDDYETALILHTKHAFRDYTQRHGYPTPIAYEITTPQDIHQYELRYPLLIKPVDSFSGRGMSKITSPAQLEPAIVAAIDNSRSRKLIVEEFVEGTLHSHSAFIKDGALIFGTIADEFCTVYPYQVNCSNIPSILPETTQLTVGECIAALVKDLNLNDGLLHTQFISDGDNFWLIECMRRCPGDLYGKMAELAMGIDYTDLLIRPYIGEALPDKVLANDNRFIARHTVSTNQKVVFTGFQNCTPGKGLSYMPLKNSGEILMEAPYDKAGILFTEFANESEMKKHTPTLANYVNIETLEY